MKRYFSILFTMLVILSVLVGCGGSDSNATTPSAAQNSTAADNEVFEVKFAHAYATTAFHHEVAEFWKEKVEAASNGRIKVTIYPAAQLMPIDQEYAALLDGRIQANFSVSSTAENLEQSYAIFNLPFVFGDTPEHLEAMKLFVQSDIYKNIILERFKEKGIMLYPGVTDPAGAFCTTKKRVESIADMAGLKMRILGGKWPELTGKALGYSTITIAGAEMPTALMQGTVDGALVRPIYITDTKVPINYVTMVPLDYGATCPLAVSKLFYDKLPADMQQVIDDVGDELFIWCADEVASRTEKSLEIMQKDMGIEVIYISDEEYQRMRELCKPVLDEFAKSIPDGQAIIDEALRCSEQIS